jgi:hypothetical protein
MRAPRIAGLVRPNLGALDEEEFDAVASMFCVKDERERGAGAQGHESVSANGNGATAENTLGSRLACDHEGKELAGRELAHLRASYGGRVALWLLVEAEPAPSFVDVAKHLHLVGRTAAPDLVHPGHTKGEVRGDDDRRARPGAVRVHAD